MLQGGLPSDQEDVNGEKLTVKKWWIFGADFFTVWCRFFFTVYADFSRFVRDINGEQKNFSLSMSFFTVSFSRFAPSQSDTKLLQKYFAGNYFSELLRDFELYRFLGAATLQKCGVNFLSVFLCQRCCEI